MCEQRGVGGRMADERKKRMSRRRRRNVDRNNRRKIKGGDKLTRRDDLARAIGEGKRWKKEKKFSFFLYLDRKKVPKC